MSFSFERLPAEKKIRIIEEAIREFSDHGFALASTNRIVKNSGIAKGSLFNYFKSKDELWLYVAEFSLEKMTALMKGKIAGMPADILERLKIITGVIIDVYIEHPLYYRFFMGVLDEGAKHLQQQLLQRNARFMSLFDFFSGVDTSRFRETEEATFLLLKWLFTGIKQELFELQQVRENPQALKEEFTSRVEAVLNALDKGIYR